MSFQGVQIDKPREKERPILSTVLQMTYHKNVSRKKSTKSITYMIASVDAG